MSDHQPGERDYRRSKYLHDATQLAISGTVAITGKFDGGLYGMISTVDCRFKQGADDVDDDLTDATTKGNRLPANTLIPISFSDEDNSYVAAITTGAAGKLEFIKLS